MENPLEFSLCSFVPVICMGSAEGPAGLQEMWFSGNRRTELHFHCPHGNKISVAEVQTFFHGEPSNRDYTIGTIRISGVLLLQVLDFFLAYVTTCALQCLVTFKDLYKDSGVCGHSLGNAW